MAMSIFLALAVAAVVACAVEAADKLLGGSEFFGEKPRIHVAAVTFGLSVGVTNFVAPRLASLPVIALLLLVWTLVVTIILAKWWYEEGTSWKELVPFWILAVMFYLAAKGAAAVAALATANVFLASVIRAIPAPVTIVVIGYCISDLLKTRGKLEELEDAEEDPPPEAVEEGE